MGRNNVKEPSTSNWHQLQAEEVVRLLDVNLETGLAADEVKRRQGKFGLNRITARPGIPAWRKFLQQFNQPLVYILLAAAAGTALLGEWVDSSVIFAVVLLMVAKGAELAAPLKSILHTKTR